MNSSKKHWIAAKVFNCCNFETIFHCNFRYLLIFGLTAHEIEDFFDKNGIEIYSGYVDDPRNTDNAWIETVAFNFHDETGSILNSIKLEAGDDAKNVRWLDLDESIQLYANHKQIVKAVSERMNSHWWINIFE